MEEESPTIFPGSRRLWPYVNLAGLHSNSALHEVRMPRRVKGNSLIHSESDDLAMIEALSCQWKRSTMLFDCGW